MAYKGYLLKFGNTKLPNKYLAYDSYEITPNQRTELEAYRDQNTNKLHRETIPYPKTKIDCETHVMYEDEKIEFQNILKNGLVNALQRKYNVEYYDPEENTYKSGEFYIPDTPFKIIRTDDETNKVLFNKIRLALIEY